MKKIINSLFFILLLTVNYVWAQEITVSGTVTDRTDKLPLPGVSVLVRGTTIGTQTDANGRYTIRVPSANAELEFRFLGYGNQIESVNNRTTIDVSMAMAAQTLDPVVVTALGQTRKRNELPFAAQSLPGEDLRRTRDPNFMNSLHGKVAGLDIRQGNNLGGSTRMSIRGNKSFFGNNQPLIVIDGVPFNNSSQNTSNQQSGGGGYDYGNVASDINPDDIESLNVLKGAAATALYGSRASNGAIIITTKKRTAKQAGFSIDFNSGFQTGTMDKSTFTNFQYEYGGGYGAIYESPDSYFLYRDIDGDGEKDFVVPMSEDAAYGAPFDRNILVYDWASFDPASPNFKQKRPWQGAKNGPNTFFTTPLSFSNAVSLSAGTEQSNFKLGFSRNDDKGILPNSKLTKNSINFSGSHELFKALTISINSNFTRTTGIGRYGTGYDDLNPAQNFRQWWQPNVDLKEQKEAYFRNLKNVTWNWADPTNIVPIYWDNPYWIRHENYETDSRNRFWGNTAVDWKITDWLSATARISLDTYESNREERIALESKEVSGYLRGETFFTEYNYDLLLNFNRKLNENFSLNGLLGTNIRRTQNSVIAAATNGGLVVHRLYALNNSLNPVLPPMESIAKVGVNGYFASTTLGFKELAFLDLTARIDESSTLPKENRVYFYPSAAASFIFSKLMKNQEWLNYGKVRLNYAEVGNSAPPLSIFDAYIKPAPFGSIPRFSMPGTKNNENLKPERTRSIEGGIEMGFWDNRLGFDLTLYQQNSIDQITPIRVSSATGYDYKYVNAGEIRNRGIELSLNGSPVISNNFSWNVSLNFTRNRNKIISMVGDALELGSFQGGITINAIPGQSYGIIRGTDFIYHSNGQKMVDATGHYQRTATSTQNLGQTNPEWSSGITNSFRYKGVSLSFLVDVRKGGSIFSLDQYYGLATGVSTATVGLNDLGNPSRLPLERGGGVILPGVKQDGSPNDIRVANEYGLYGYTYQPDAAFVYDAGFVKLRELSLGYNLPDRWINRLKGVKGVQFSLVGRNLWIIHKNMPEADPEDNVGNPNLQGYQVGSYPTYRTYGFNIKVNF